MAIEERTRLTADELQCFEGGPNMRYELIDRGVAELSPSPGPEHGRIGNNAAYDVTAFVRPRRLGRVYAAEQAFAFENRRIRFGPRILRLLLAVGCRRGLIRQAILP